MQATSLTYLTIVLGSLANILLRRSEHGLFTRYQLHNKLLWGAYALSLFCILMIIYSPLNGYFHSGPLSLTDWLFALLAAAIFIAIRELQRHSKKHSRRALFATHGYNNVKRYLKAI